jgi:hypothetical protein
MRSDLLLDWVNSYSTDTFSRMLDTGSRPALVAKA